MSLWTFVQAPLILGADLTASSSANVTAMVTNPGMLAMSRDILTSWEALRVCPGQTPSARVVRDRADHSAGACYIIWKATSKTSPSVVYLGVFNLLPDTYTLDVPWYKLGWPASLRAQAMDLWTGQQYSIDSAALTAVVPGHGPLVLRMLVSR